VPHYISSLSTIVRRELRPLHEDVVQGVTATARVAGHPDKLEGRCLVQVKGVRVRRLEL
jgi:hypothetical protein